MTRVGNGAGETNTSLERGPELLEMLLSALRELEECRDQKGVTEFRAYLHGQVYGLATALRLIYPGPGNLGEKAALAARPVLTEHNCRCGEDGPG